MLGALIPFYMVCGGVFIFCIITSKNRVYDISFDGEGNVIIDLLMDSYTLPCDGFYEVNCALNDFPTYTIYINYTGKDMTKSFALVNTTRFTNYPGNKFPGINGLKQHFTSAKII